MIDTVLAELIITLFRLLGGNSRAMLSGLVSFGLSLVILGIVWALMLVGLGLIIWALYLYLTSFLSPPIAALISGLVALLIAGGLVLSTRLLMVRLRSQKEINAGPPSWLQRYPKETVLAALTAGFLVGASSEVRRALAEGIIWLLKQKRF